jgi:hypothetical protein
MKRGAQADAHDAPKQDAKTEKPSLTLMGTRLIGKIP